MNEKTEELRDIFMDVTDEEEVTQSQTETHGSLASEAEVDERLRATVERMREKVGFDVDLDDETLAAIVRGFYAGESDAEIAEERLDGVADDADADLVRRARLDLHLLRDDDTDAPFDLEELRTRRDESVETLADDLDVAESTVRRYERVVDAQAEIRRVNDQFRSEFEGVLQDRDLAERLTSDVQEDGLEDATEGQETDVDI